MKNRDAIPVKTEKLQTLDFNYNCICGFKSAIKTQLNHK